MEDLIGTAAVFLFFFLSWLAKQFKRAAERQRMRRMQQAARGQGASRRVESQPAPSRAQAPDLSFLGGALESLGIELPPELERQLRGQRPQRRPTPPPLDKPLPAGHPAAPPLEAQHRRLAPPAYQRAQQRPTVEWVDTEFREPHHDHLSHAQDPTPAPLPAISPDVIRDAVVLQNLLGRRR